jgi:hypothetical protein
MDVTFSCPQCEQPVCAGVRPGERLIHCPACGQEIRVAENAWDGEQLVRCLVCPSTELYLRKDFPQRLGLAIVAAGIVASSVAWGYHNVILTFGILFVTAAMDFVLYWIVGNALMCYRCHAQYRSAAPSAGHAPFDLETYERHRQLAARSVSHKRNRAEQEATERTDGR